MNFWDVLQNVSALVSTGFGAFFLFGRYYQRFIHIEETLLKKIDPGVSLMNGALLSLQSVLREQGTIQYPFYEPGSSLKLTERGREFLRASGLQAAMDGQISRLDIRVQRMAGPHGRKVVKADIWEAAQNLMMLDYHEDWMAQVREYAYEHGANPADAIIVGAIYLTDRVTQPDFAHA